MSIVTFNNQNFILNKLIFEVKYEESILFQDIRVTKDIHKRLQKDFPSIQRDDEGFRFINKDDRYQAILSPTKTSLISEKPSSISNFKQKALSVIEESTSKQEVQEFTRVGLRTMIYQETPNFVSAAEIIKNKLISISDLFSEAKEDNKLKISFSFTDKELGYNINIIPQAEIEVNFDEFYEPESSNKIGIVYDIDMYSIQKINPHGLNSFYRTAGTKVEEVVSKLKAFLAGE